MVVRSVAAGSEQVDPISIGVGIAKERLLRGETTFSVWSFLQVTAERFAYRPTPTELYEGAQRAGLTRVSIG